MRKRNLFVLIIMLSAASISACAGVAAAKSPTSASLQETMQLPRTISVTGSGKAILSPDIAYIYIGVHTENQDAAQAVADNNQQTQEVKDALVAAGINENDIQTTNFSIYPRQDYDTQGQPTGTITYVVDNSVNVIVRDLDQIGEVLNEAVAAGANSVNGISFDVSDRTEALSAARKDAFANAEIIAQELADEAGVTLGAVHSISTIIGGGPVPLFEGRGGGAEAMMAEAPVPISPGQMIVTVELNVVYDIE